jgi:glycine oxidase
LLFYIVSVFILKSNYQNLKLNFIKNIDYIIVGSGLAGICFAETALFHNKTILVIDNNSQNASTIAAGLYNPVILKRFSEVWNAKEQLVLLDTFYKNIEKKINATIDFKIPILRKFFSIEEQNNWFAAADNPKLTPFLSLDLISKNYNGINAQFRYGEVLKTGFVDTAKLLNLYQKFLLKSNSFLNETFEYDKIIFQNDQIEYKDYTAKHIIFAEGYGLHSNPFFNFLPLDGTKGELLILRAPDLNIETIVNTSVFILPLGNHLFKVGATYNWKDKTNKPTEAGKNELLEKIKETLNCDFEIISHFAGVRPTVKDRKPLVGTHFEYKNLHILNGLGTRGVMLGPAMAKALFENIEIGTPLDAYIDINRVIQKLK